MERVHSAYQVERPNIEAAYEDLEFLAGDQWPAYAKQQREAQKRLPEWIANWERGRDPAHLAASERFHQEYVALILELDKTLAPEQRHRAAANFRRYAEDFRVLARRARAEPTGK